MEVVIEKRMPPQGFLNPSLRASICRLKLPALSTLAYLGTYRPRYSKNQQNIKYIFKAHMKLLTWSGYKQVKPRKRGGD